MSRPEGRRLVARHEALQLFVFEEDAMQLEQRIVGDLAIVKVAGDITLNQGGTVLLKDKVQSLLHQGYKKLLFDLGGVSHVDSAGLGELVQAYVAPRTEADHCDCCM